MIKRQYFYNIKWLHNDGKQSYSYISGIVTHTALLPDAEYIYEYIQNELKESKKKQYPNGLIEVISFNRV